MDLDKEIIAILTSVVLISILTISVLLYVHFKAKVKAKKEAGVANDQSSKK